MRRRNNDKVINDHWLVERCEFRKDETSGYMAAAIRRKQSALATSVKIIRRRYQVDLPIQ